MIENKMSIRLHMKKILRHDLLGKCENFCPTFVKISRNIFKGSTFVNINIYVYFNEV
jgi:hypothetical protein